MLAKVCARADDGRSLSRMRRDRAARQDCVQIASLPRMMACSRRAPVALPFLRRGLHQARELRGRGRRVRVVRRDARARGAHGVRCVARARGAELARARRKRERSLEHPVSNQPIKRSARASRSGGAVSHGPPHRALPFRWLTLAPGHLFFPACDANLTIAPRTPPLPRAPRQVCSNSVTWRRRRPASLIR